MNATTTNLKSRAEQRTVNTVLTLIGSGRLQLAKTQAESLIDHPKASDEAKRLLRHIISGI